MNRSFMVVEDNPQDEFFILRAIRPWEAAVARDGEEALSRLLPAEGKVADPLPCALFLDIMLPRINGLEVLRRLREAARTRYLPIIMFSSSAEPRDLQKSYSLGANAYVQKSSDIKIFEERVKHMAAFWGQSNVPPP